MASLVEAHEDVEANGAPRNVQFGAGALSVLDGSQAPTGYHTAYAPDGDPDNLRARRDSRLRQAGRHALLRARARPRMAACPSNHHEVGGTRGWREDRSSNARAATTRSSTTSTGSRSGRRSGRVG